MTGMGRFGSFGFLERGRGRRSTGYQKGRRDEWRSRRDGSRDGDSGEVERLGEEQVDGFLIVLEVEFHICRGKGVYERVEEVSYRGRRELVDEVVEAVIIKQVEDDEAGSVGCGINEVVVDAISG